jgi:hypothetical protein
LRHARASFVAYPPYSCAERGAPLAYSRALAIPPPAATPAAETLQIAVTAYMRARADFDAASGASQTTIQRTATALSVAARRLNEAVVAAQAPIAELEGLVRAHRG